MYSHYTKKQLVNNNGMVLHVPHYETIDSVKANLGVANQSSNRSNDVDTDLIGAPPVNNSDIDLQKYENDGSLLFVDSLKAHFHADFDIKSFYYKINRACKEYWKEWCFCFC